MSEKLSADLVNAFANMGPEQQQQDPVTVSVTIKHGNYTLHREDCTPLEAIEMLQELLDEPSEDESDEQQEYQDE